MGSNAILECKFLSENAHRAGNGTKIEPLRDLPNGGGEFGVVGSLQFMQQRVTELMVSAILETRLVR
jgi:hypothetical protein